jgi:putative ABC transport system permease protein
VVGAASPLAIGDEFHATHGHGTEAFLGEHHPQELVVVGRLPPTGSPWDRAILVPIEFVWEVHGLPDGHGRAGEGSGQAGLGGGDHRAVSNGPPFDLERMPGIPAAVVKPATIAAAYGLRSALQTIETTAFFPAEVLVQLYELLGDIRVVMSWLAIATEVLLIAAVLAGILILMRLYRGRFAILRALGASRLYVFAVAWSFSFILIAAGSLLGLGVAALLSGVLSEIFENAIGVALQSGLGWTEINLAASVVAVGALLAAAPAALIYRQPVAEALRATA